MKQLHLHFALLVLLLLSSLGVSTPSVDAATSILPGGGEAVDGFVASKDLTALQCSELVDQVDVDYSENVYETIPETITIEEGGQITRDEMLGCALKSGNMHFWMIPYFVNYALEFVISVAGVLAVLMVIVGGYFYIYGAVTDDKEKGKTVISYALGGYALVLVSWFIVNALLLLVTQ